MQIGHKKTNESQNASFTKSPMIFENTTELKMLTYGIVSSGWFFSSELYSPEAHPNMEEFSSQGKRG